MKHVMEQVIAKVIVSPLLESAMAIMETLCLLAAMLYSKAEHKRMEMLQTKQRVMNQYQ